MTDNIDTAVVFINGDQELWLGFSHFKNYSKHIAKFITDELKGGSSTAEVVAAIVRGVTERTRAGITFDKPDNLQHSIFEFNFDTDRVSLLDSSWNVEKVRWSIQNFLQRAENFNG